MFQVRVKVPDTSLRLGYLFGCLQNSGRHPTQEVRVRAKKADISIALPPAAVFFHSAEIGMESWVQRVFAFWAARLATVALVWIDRVWQVSMLS